MVTSTDTINKCYKCNIKYTPLIAEEECIGPLSPWNCKQDKGYSGMHEYPIRNKSHDYPQSQTHTHTVTHVHVHMHTLLIKHTCMHTYKHTQTVAHSHTHMHTHIHSHKNMHAYTHMPAHTHIQTCMHTHTHSHTHTPHTYTHYQLDKTCFEKSSIVPRLKKQTKKLNWHFRNKILDSKSRFWFLFTSSKPHPQVALYNQWDVAIQELTH